MEEKLRGIVLGGVPYGENDKILTIFTLEKGTVSARIKGVKKAGAKLKFASEPFCFAEFVFLSSPNKRTVVNASLIDSFFPIRQDIVKYFCGGAALEFVRRFAKESIVSPELFLLLTDLLKKLAYADANPKSALTKFFIDALKLAGYSLTLGRCARCGDAISGRVFFDSASGGFYCENCKTERAREINFSTFDVLNKIDEGAVCEEPYVTATLKLIDYYLKNKTDESLNSLKELLKL